MIRLDVDKVSTYQWGGNNADLLQGLTTPGWALRCFCPSPPSRVTGKETEFEFERLEFGYSFDTITSGCISSLYYIPCSIVPHK